MSSIDDASTLLATWWKSSRSDSAAQCVECALLDPATLPPAAPAGAVLAVRDSKNPAGPALLLSRRAMAAFTSAL